MVAHLRACGTDMVQYPFTHSSSQARRLWCTPGDEVTDCARCHHPLEKKRMRKGKTLCPGRDSNPDWDDFKSSASADWATGARTGPARGCRAGPVPGDAGSSELPDVSRLLNQAFYGPGLVIEPGLRRPGRRVLHPASGSTSSALRPRLPRASDAKQTRRSRHAGSRGRRCPRCRVTGRG
jgi:hypothetical protein